LPLADVSCYKIGCEWQKLNDGRGVPIHWSSEELPSL
jgi:hypothetical protein